MHDKVEADGIVNDLLENQIQIEQCEGRKKAFKAQIKDYVERVGKVDTDLGCVKYRHKTTIKTFDRDKVLAYIKQNCNADIADDVDRNCTVVKERDSYVMVCLDRSKFPKKFMPEVNKSTRAVVPNMPRMSDEVAEYNLSCLKGLL